MPLPKFRRGSSDELKRHGCMNNVPQAEAGDVSASRLGLLAVVRLPPFRELIPAGAGGERWPEQPGWSLRATPARQEPSGLSEINGLRELGRHLAQPEPTRRAPARQVPPLRFPAAEIPSYGSESVQPGREMKHRPPWTVNRMPCRPPLGLAGRGRRRPRRRGVLLRAWAWLADTLALFVFALLKALRRSRG